MRASVITRRPAYELLLACATWDASDIEVERAVQRAAADIDWSGWLETARWHRLIPHAHRMLTAARAPIPAGVGAALLNESIAIGAGALARARQLLDLDIVVQPRDLDRARDALLGAGYASRTEMSRAQERVLQGGYGHFTYTAPGNGAMVELHWRFAARRYPWSIPPSHVFARAALVDLAGRPVAGPEFADMLLLQVMHGTRHQWERLEWLVAFVQLLKRVRGDDERLIARAAANGSSRALGLSLRLSRDLLGAPLTPRLSKLADDPRSAALAAHIMHTLEGGMFSTAQPYEFNMAVMDEPRDRLRYVALSVLCPTPREWEVVRLPDWLVFLYYPLRLARLAALLPRRIARAVVRLKSVRR